MLFIIFHNVISAENVMQLFSDVLHRNKKGEYNNMKKVISRVLAITSLTALLVVPSISIASAKKGNPDRGLWYYDCKSKVTSDYTDAMKPYLEAALNGTDGWYKASVRNADGVYHYQFKYNPQNGPAHAEAYAVSPDFSFLIWNTKLNIDHAYYDHF